MRSWTQLTATTGRSTMAAATLHGKPSYSRRRHMRSSAQGQFSHQRVSRYSGEVVARHTLAPHVAGVLFSFVAVLVLWTMVFLPAPARAAGEGLTEVSATQMKVSVWPEYDDPRVLVIYQGDLDSAVSLPARVEFNFPKGAEIGMACEVNPSGGHACKPYQLTDHGDYQTLSFLVESQRKVFFEYYYEAFPGFPGTDPLREFDFTFRPGFSVDALSLEVQEPMRAREFTLDPEFPSVTSDSQGLNYHVLTDSDVKVGDVQTVSISYSKDDNDPSVTPGSATGSGEASREQASPDQQGSNTTLILIVGVLGAVALVLGGYAVLRPASSRGRGSGSRGQRGQAGSAKRNKKSGVGVRYCTHCGSQVESSSRFCPDCGSEKSG